MVYCGYSNAHTTLILPSCPVSSSPLSPLCVVHAVYAVVETLPDARRSWDNLMWNLEIDDDDDESEDAVVSAKSSVLAALVEVSLRILNIDQYIFLFLACVFELFFFCDFVLLRFVLSVRAEGLLYTVV